MNKPGLIKSESVGSFTAPYENKTRRGLFECVAFCKRTEKQVFLKRKMRPFIGNLSFRYKTEKSDLLKWQRICESIFLLLGI